MSFQDLLVGESTATTTENRVITVSLYFCKKYKANARTPCSYFMIFNLEMFFFTGRHCYKPIFIFSKPSKIQWALRYDVVI